MRRRWYWVGGIMLSLGAIVFSLYAVYVGFTRITMLRDDAMLIQSVSVYGPVGSNSVFVETDAGGVLVDSFLPLLAWKLEDALDDTDSRVHTLVNTHWHPDHNGGNGRFKEEADIVVHRNTGTRMEGRQKGYGLTAPDSYHELGPWPSERLPTRVIDSDELLKLGDHRVLLRHFPNAHTDGDLVVFFLNLNLICTGDIIWPDAFPSVDVFNGGSVRGIRDAVAALIAQSDEQTIIVPGHGRVLSKNDLEIYLNMLDASLKWKSSTAFPKALERWASRLVPIDSWIATLEGRVPGAQS